MTPDAVLFISFGGPDKREDILPFLEIVTRGRGIPKERLEEVAHHYDVIGGKSPINEITRRQAAGLERELCAQGSALKVYVGQRNWHPFLEETLRRMAADGVKRAIGFITAAHRCEASLERYINAVNAARKEIGVTAPEIHYVSPWFDDRLFVDAIAERVEDALKTVPLERRPSLKWFFTAHSIPSAMAKDSAYVLELQRTAELVAQKLGQPEWALAYSSRSGNPRDPWLEPDVCDLIRSEAAKGTKDILFIPIGFVADHVEILFDLDVEARAAAHQAGVTLYRSASVGDHPVFYRMMADVVLARLDEPERQEQDIFPNMTPRRIVVIGGGITGLAAAWRLHQHFQSSGLPLNLQLLERSAHPGGSLKSATREGFLLEMGPDCFISEKPRGVELCRELGLESELIQTHPDYRRSFILRRGTFYPVPEGFYLMGPSRYRPFLESGLLSWPGKFRAMLEPLMPSRPQTDESLASFVRRRFGQEMLDWMAQPLIAGIYGASPEDLSLRATFPQFLEMERTYGSIVFGLKKCQGAVPTASGARYSLFVALRGGMQKLTDTLATKLGSTLVKSGTRVKEIRRVDGVWQVVKASGEILSADAVCVALPSYAAAELLRSQDADLSNDLASIPYAPAATLNIALREIDVRRPLNGVGFVVPHKENRLILGCTLVQNKFEGRVPKGFLLIRAFLGGVQSAWTNEKDDPLTQRVFAELKGLLGITGQPMFTQLERYDRALPQYNVGHIPKILKIEERVLRHDGLSLAGNWSYGVGIPDCIVAGERAAERIMSHLERQEPAAL